MQARYCICGTFGLTIAPMNNEVAELQIRAIGAGIPLLHVTRRAGIDYSTWCRWKTGTKPNLVSLRAMQRALSELIAKKVAA